jgi:membrane dipeptidase
MKSDAGLTPVFSKADVKKAKADGKLGITFSLADSSFIENPQRDFELYSLLGVTHCVLSAMHNYCGESCYDRDSGLSPYGKYMVTLFNSSPLYLDGSLGGYKTTMEAMEISQKPFIFSHVNPYGVCRNSRNIRDDQITACAKTGGVIGITFIGGYLGSETPDSELVFRNIDYICQLVGSEHVGIGSNYMSDTTAFWSVIKNYQSTDEISSGGCFDYSKLPEVVDLMLTHGYSEQDVRNILGLNWFSLFAD